MTKTRTSTLSSEDREALQEQVARDVEEYLAKGGKITQYPPRAYSTPAVSYSSWHSDSDTHKNKHTAVTYNVEPITDPIKRMLGAFIPRFKRDV